MATTMFPDARDERRALIAQAIYDAADSLGVNARSYSGRGMYGERCLAISGDEEEALFRTLCEASIELEEAVPAPRRDQMGMGAVWYWPDLPAPAKDLDEDYCPETGGRHHVTWSDDGEEQLCDFCDFSRPSTEEERQEFRRVMDEAVS